MTFYSGETNVIVLFYVIENMSKEHDFLSGGDENLIDDTLVEIFLI